MKPILSRLDRSPTGRLAQFIYHLLRPYVSDILQSTTFVNELDFIQKLIDYTTREQHCLQPTTLFVTLTITNFDTMFSYDTIVTQLAYFFMDYSTITKMPCPSIVSNKLQSISISTVQELIRLVLENTIFYYGDSIYRVVKGSLPNSLLLYELLSNIYLFMWQKQIFGQDRRFQSEFYGR